LLEIGIRREVDVAGFELVEQFARFEEAVVPQHMIGHAQVLGQGHQAVAIGFAFGSDQIGVRRADDAIDRVGMRGHDGGQRLDRGFQPLALAQQAEGHDHVLAGKARARLEIGIAAKRTIGRTMGDDRDPRRLHAIDLVEQVATMLAHHHHAAGAIQNMVEHGALLGRGCASTVCSVTISGAAIRSTSSSTMAPQSPPKMPYSC
jgi:hypothetical protein